MFDYLKINLKAAIVLTFMVKNHSKWISHILFFFRGILEELYQFRMGRDLNCSGSCSDSGS